MPSSSGLSLIIRPMELEDVPRVREIDRVSFTMPWPEKAYHHEISDETRSLALVAEVEGRLDTLEAEGHQARGPQAEGCQLVGLLVVWLVLDEAHIATIAVHPEFRNLGISRHMLVAGLKGAIGRGAKTATLEVRAGNQVAQELYRGFHFKVAGRRIRYYRDNDEDALIMSRDLLELENYPAGYLGWLESGDWRKKKVESHHAGGQFFDNIDLSKVE